jgi:hypothetical protein
MDTKQPLKRDALAPSLRCARCHSEAIVLWPAVGSVCADCGALQILAPPAKHAPAR